MKWYEWTRYIRDNCDAPPDVKALLLYLATYADADGHCFPAYPRLAGVMGVAVSTVQRRRQRAVELGWLQVSGGRWRGDPTHYQLVKKGTDGAYLPQPGKVLTVSTERSITFHEGGDGAPSMEARTSPLERRRDSARAVRKAGPYRDRFLATFHREYGHLYPSKGPRVLRPMHPAMASIVKEGRPAA